MDRQVVYNRVRDHLLAQGKRSAAGDLCVYRSPDGLKCAIGALIDDRYYTPELETCSTESEGVMSAISNSLGVVIDAYSEESYFLQGLQDIHDDQCPGEWREALTDFALNWEIQP